MFVYVSANVDVFGHIRIVKGEWENLGCSQRVHKYALINRLDRRAVYIRAQLPHACAVRSDRPLPDVNLH